MSEEDFFRRHMRSLGVRPIDEEEKDSGASGRRADPESPEPRRTSRGRRRPERKRRALDEVSDEERELFLRAVEQLEATPDKDPKAAGGGLEKVRLPRRSGVPIARRLDLHGLTADEARRRLGAFLDESLAIGARTVLVITGKGRNSPGRRGVLRATVETWLRRHAAGRVDRYAEAPAALGGSGALVLWLRAPEG